METNEQPPPKPESPKNRVAETYAGFEKRATPFSAIESLLKSPGKILFEIHEKNSWSVVAILFFLTLFGFAGYGAVMGMFSGGMQILYSSVKVSLGQLAAALLCLPSFYVFNSLVSPNTKFSDSLGILFSFLTLIAILLLAFAPILWIFSESTDSFRFIGTLHVACYVIATIFAARHMLHSVEHIAGKSADILVLWTLIFLFVSFQMTATLRPILGKSEKLLSDEKKSFFVHWFEKEEKSEGEKQKDEKSKYEKGELPEKQTNTP